MDPTEKRGAAIIPFRLQACGPMDLEQLERQLRERLEGRENDLSYHMKRLREAGLVSGSRRGRRVEYRIELAGLGRLKRDLERLANPADEPREPQRVPPRLQGVSERSFHRKER